MTGKEKVLKTAKNKKVFRTGDVSNLPPSYTHRYLAQLMEEGSIN